MAIGRTRFPASLSDSKGKCPAKFHGHWRNRPSTSSPFRPAHPRQGTGLKRRKGCTIYKLISLPREYVPEAMGEPENCQTRICTCLSKRVGKADLPKTQDQMRRLRSPEVLPVGRKCRRVPPKGRRNDWH